MKNRTRLPSRLTAFTLIKLLVANLEAAANMSVSHYFVVFKQSTGFTPIDLFIRLRIRPACELLDSTGMCIEEVALALGHEDPYNTVRSIQANPNQPT